MSNHYKFVFADNSEFYADVEGKNNRVTTIHLNEKAQRLIYNTSIRAPFGQYETTRVKAYEVTLEGGKPVTRLATDSLQVQKPNQKLTGEEYNVLMDSLLNEIPEKLQSFISHFAYEYGHSSGYEGCINIAQELISDLDDVISDYRRLLNSV